METRTDPDHARAALADVEAGRDAVRRVPVAPWFLPGLAALVAVIFLAQLLPTGGAIAVTLLAALGAGMLAGAQQRASGAIGLQIAKKDRPRALAVVGVLVALVVAATIVDAAVAWVVGAAVASACIVLAGRG